MQWLYQWLVLCTTFIICTTTTVPSPTLPTWIDTVHLVISNHFDCGFAGIDPQLGFAVNVVNKYFNVYFPMAVSNGVELANYNLTFTWLTQSWLISMYFDCPLNMGLICPNQTAKQYIQYGIDKRYIYWHSFPFNSQMEVYDASMLEFGLQLSQDLSIQHQAPVSSIISQRDVPGMTRSMIPILIRNNITAISIGVNTGSSPPDVPPIFKWKDMNSNKSIIAMLNPGGYGNVNFPSPVYLSNYNEALVFAWNGDNAGPPTVENIMGYYNTVQYEFPNANIFASSITNFVRNISKHADVVDSLKVIDSEIGDTWCHGIQSDPWKTAVNRIAQRHRTNCLEQSLCSLGSNAFYNFSRFLLKNGEHTWGGDIKAFLGFTEQNSAYYAWSNKAFYAALASNNSVNAMTNFRSTWYEQRNWGIFNALEALSLSTNPADLQLYKNITSEMNLITNVESPFAINSKDWRLADINNGYTVKSLKTGENYAIKFDAVTGALVQLQQISKNVNYASKDNLLGEFIYQTMTETDFDNFMNNYAIILPPPWWMQGDFGKKGLNEDARPSHQYITASFKNLYQSGFDSNEFLVEMDFGAQQAILTERYGVPETVFNFVSFNSNTSTLSMTVTWLNKSMTRIPEDIYFRLNPMNCSGWNVEKFGEFIGLKNIIQNGTAHMHNVVGKAYCQQNGGSQFDIIPIDSGLAVFMAEESDEFSPFPTPMVEASDIDGIGFVLYDNTWGTNYPVYWPFDRSNLNTTYRFDIML